MNSFYEKYRSHVENVVDNKVESVMERWEETKLGQNAGK